MRIIIVHPETGQRLAIEEADYDNPDAHPLNHDHLDYSHDQLGQPQQHEHAGRRGKERLSFKDEGWRAEAQTEVRDGRNVETPLPHGYKLPGGR